MFNNEYEYGNELEFANESYEFGNEFGHEFGYELGHELNESLEMELAHELLNVSNEQELNHFLGKLIKGVGKGISAFAKSGVGKALGGALKSVAKTALPLVGKAAGTFFGGPLGGMVGGKLGSMASNLFELELEGLSPEDREFEVARAYVRFANEAINNTNNLSRQYTNSNPQTLVRTAINQAATTHAPGLVKSSGGRALAPTGGNSQAWRGLPQSGTWSRRGRVIILS